MRMNQSSMSNIVSMEAAMGRTAFLETKMKDLTVPEHETNRLTDIALIGLAENGHTKALVHLIEDVGVSTDKVIKNLIENAAKNGHMDTVKYLVQCQKKGIEDFSKGKNGFVYESQLEVKASSHNYEITSQKDHKGQRTPDKSEPTNQKMEVKGGKSGIFINTGTFNGNITQSGEPLNIRDFSIHNPSARGVMIQEKMKDMKREDECADMRQKDESSFSMDEYIRIHAQNGNDHVHISTKGLDLKMDTNDNVYIHFDGNR